MIGKVQFGNVRTTDIYGSTLFYSARNIFLGVSNESI